MKKYKKGLFLLSIIGALIPGLPCDAKVEETNEVQLIDMGHGIWVPSSFDVVDENGNYVTLSNLDASLCEEKEIDEEFYSVTLDNGYRAEKEWFHTSPSSNVGFSRTTVYNEQGEVVFVLGSNESGQIIFGMQDESGNYVKNTYNRYSYTNMIDVETQMVTIENEDGTLKPMSRVTYDTEAQVSKKYVSWGDEMQLDEKYDYSTEGGPTCTVYGKVNTMYNDYDQEDEYYESYSYKQDDMQSFTAMQMVFVIGIGPMYQPHNVTLPTKVTQNGEELQIYWLKYSFEGVNDWADDEYTRLTEEARDGRPIDMRFYFTKEQIEIIESEGITTVEELQNKYPEFMDTFGGFTDTYVGEYEESEAERKEREAQEAIISPDIETDEESENVETDAEPEDVETDAEPEDVETEAEPEYDGKWKTLPDGTKVCWQDLTGDVVPVNGLVPTKIMTQEFETPNGMFQSAILYDDSGNIVMHCVLYDMAHTNYKYVYLTSVDLAANLAEIAGTDTPVSGNLAYFGETTYDTENGQVTGDVYGEY